MSLPDRPVTMATLVDDEQPPRIKWKVLAILSWLTPLVTIAAGVVYFRWIPNLSEHYLSWTMLIGWATLTYLLAVVPLVDWTALGWNWAKTNAVVGVVANLLASACLVFCMLAAVITVQSAKTRRRPALTPQIAPPVAQVDPREIARQERAAQLRQQQEAAERRRQAEEDGRFDQWLAKRNEIHRKNHDQKLRQFYEGFGYSRLQLLPVQPQFDSPRPKRLLPTIPLPPLKVEPYQAAVTPVDRALAVQDSWTVADLHIQKLDLREVNPKWLPAANESPSVGYLLADDQLLEIDLDLWRVKRQVDLGGEGISMAHCREGIAIVLTRPGRLVLLHQKTLQGECQVSIPDLRQVAATADSSRVFLRLQKPGDYRQFLLAEVNLETKAMVRLLTSQEAVDVLGKIAERPYASGFQQIAITPEGETLIGIGTGVCRWSLTNNDFRCHGVKNFRINSREATLSRNGRYLCTSRELFDLDGEGGVDRPLYEPHQSTLRVCCPASSDGSLATADGESNLVVIKPDGMVDSFYRFQQGVNDRTKNIVALTKANSWLIETSRGYFAATRLPSGAPPQEGPERLAESPVEEWQKVEGERGFHFTLPSKVAGYEFSDATAACLFADAAQVICSDDTTLTRFDAATGEALRSVELPQDMSLKLLRVSKAGLIAFSGPGFRVWVIDPETLQPRRCFKAAKWKTSAASLDDLVTTSPTSSRLLYSGVGLQWLDLETGEVERLAWLSNWLDKNGRRDAVGRTERLRRIRYAADQQRLFLFTSARMITASLSDHAITELYRATYNNLLQGWVSKDDKKVAVLDEREGFLCIKVDQPGAAAYRFQGDYESKQAAFNSDLTVVVFAGKVGELSRASEHHLQQVPVKARYVDNPRTRRAEILPHLANYFQASADAQRLLLVRKDNAALLSFATLPRVDKAEPRIAGPADSKPQGIQVVAGQGSISRKQTKAEATIFDELNVEPRWRDIKWWTFSPDGNWLYYRISPQELRQVDAATLEHQRTLAFPTAMVSGMQAVQPAAGGLGVFGKPVASIYGHLLVFDFDDLSLKAAYDLPAPSRSDEIAVAEDVPQLFFAKSQRLQVVDLTTGEVVGRQDLAILPEHEGVTALGHVRQLWPSGDGQTVICRGVDGFCRVQFDDQQRLQAKLGDLFRDLSTDQIRWDRKLQRLDCLESYQPELRTDIDRDYTFRFFCGEGKTRPCELVQVPLTGHGANRPLRGQRRSPIFYFRPVQGDNCEVICFERDTKKTTRSKAPYAFEEIYPLPQGARALGKTQDGEMIMIRFQSR